MVSNPENYVEDMADAGADFFTFHIEVIRVKSHIVILFKNLFHLFCVGTSWTK